MGYYVDCFDIGSFSVIEVHSRFNVSNFIFVSLIKSIGFLLYLPKSLHS